MMGFFSFVFTLLCIFRRHKLLYFPGVGAVPTRKMSTRTGVPWDARHGRFWSDAILIG
jgi:hypothetical protein